MALSSEHFRENPWWTNRDALSNDPHLRRLEEQPLVFRHRVPFELDVDAVYTIRGPRQVGKTTFLKRLVRRLLHEDQVDPRSVMYADITASGVTDHTELQAFVREFVSYVRTREQSTRIFVLLDEVTGVDDWGVAIRSLHGRGLLDRVTVVVTGSHALDLKKGGEQAPGRRGAVDHWDWMMMPLGFRDFVELHAPHLLDNVPTLTSFDPQEVYTQAEETHFVGTELRELFTRYLTTGGYPLAIAAEARDARIEPRVYRTYRDAFRGEIRRAGLEESYVRELISWAGHRRLAQEFSWRNASDDTGIGSKDTARKYLESAEALFLWHIYLRVIEPDQPRPALKSPKKLFPADPLGWHVLESWALGQKDPWGATIDRLNDPQRRGDLVESVCADHFRRRFGQFSFYYRDKKGREEIDFVLFEDNAPLTKVEVKYQTRMRAKHRKALAAHGGGLLLTPEHLAWTDDNVASLPVAYLLAMLPWELTLFADPD